MHDYRSIAETSAGHLRDCTTLTQLRRRVAMLNNTANGGGSSYSFRIQLPDLSRATLTSDSKTPLSQSDVLQINLHELSPIIFSLDDVGYNIGASIFSVSRDFLTLPSDFYDAWNVP